MIITFLNVQADDTMYTFNIPPDAPIGMYSIKLFFGGNMYNTVSMLVILFNPWSPQDSVYLPRMLLEAKSHLMIETDQLSEYINGEQGYIWLSPRGGMGWTFDQFNFNVLRVSLHFISSLSPKDRFRTHYSYA